MFTTVDRMVSVAIDVFVMFLICYFSFIFRCHLCAYCPGHDDE